MKVSDILRFKSRDQSSPVLTITPEDLLSEAVSIMDRNDLGSLVVMSNGKVVGMLTFREVIKAVVKNGGSVGTTTVWKAMDNGPLTCTPQTHLDEVRRMMLARHTRYLPVVEGEQVQGVISFYDVAKAIVESQSFENEMLKAYIRDWPSDETPQP